jgi:hypothetical protein
MQFHSTPETEAYAEAVAVCCSGAMGMSVSPDSLCMGCMDSKQGGLCPNPGACGWTEGTEARAFPLLLPRTILENRYVVGRVLGQGGFGITYLAADLREYRKLALKEYFPSSFATRTTDRRTVTYAGPGNREPYLYGLKKFEEEAQTLQRFQTHPNIVSVIRSFNANGTGYIVMEYLDGVTLLGHLRRQEDGKISFDAALSILIPIMDALREVHRAGMIHRDISPDNIYLCRSGRIKLLDFGAARLALRDQTQSQQLILKPGYTPEEQYRSSGVAGPFTDIYSLAATMYRCITGQVPPEAPERLSEDHLQPPSRLATLPAHAEKALLKALAVRSKDRYQTMEDFQRDISPPPDTPSKSSVEVVSSFILWWTIGGVFMFAGSILRTKGTFWLFWAGLIPAALSLLRITALRRPGARLDMRLWVLFSFLASLGILLTGLNPLGAVLLAASIFVARSLGSRLSGPKTPSARPRSILRCINGELAGNTLELGSEPIVIGRAPELANVIVPLPEISGAHVRVWVDAATGNAWIEDLKSHNGTYVKKSAPYSGWLQIHGREILAEGDRFCLSGEEVAAFEIHSSGEESASG